MDELAALAEAAKGRIGLGQRFRGGVLWLRQGQKGTHRIPIPRGGADTEFFLNGAVGDRSCSILMVLCPLTLTPRSIATQVVMAPVLSG